jgi:hypothetical protein
MSLPEYTYESRGLQFGKVVVHCNICRRDILTCELSKWNDSSSDIWEDTRAPHDKSMKHQQNLVLVRLE